jgi:hypothetical protein
MECRRPHRGSGGWRAVTVIGVVLRRHGLRPGSGHRWGLLVCHDVNREVERKKKGRRGLGRRRQRKRRRWRRGATVREPRGEERGRSGVGVLFFC